MNEDNLLLGQAEDKINQCFNRSMPTNTIFLDQHQQSLLRGAFMRNENGCTLEFYGGYDDAERVILLCLPDYVTADMAEIERIETLTIMRVMRNSIGGRPLGHGDYLGSLTGLGISRNMIGDILVRDDGADIIVTAEIAEFILKDYVKAGSVDISVTRHPISELIIPERKFKRITDTVASMRLDNLTASAFGISRTKAAQAIGRGLVFVNHIEAVKADMQLDEGAQIVLRHKGKAELTEVGGQSRKGRIYVVFNKY